MIFAAKHSGFQTLGNGMGGIKEALIQQAVMPKVLPISRFRSRARSDAWRLPRQGRAARPDNRRWTPVPRRDF
jgi:hypothetical protein